MNQNNNLFSKILKNGGLFFILIIFTFYFIFKDVEIKSIIETISNINIFYMVPAIGCMFIFILCESLNIKRNLKALGYEITVLKCFNYSVNGFFFSSITPSASGGQPMQVYKMYKDNIKVSHGTLVLLIELIFFQIVTVMYSLIGFISQKSLLLGNINTIKYLFIIGVIINSVVVIVLLITIFSYSTISKIINMCTSILRTIGFKKTEEIKEKAYSIINDYKDYGSYIMKNKLIIFKTFITVCIQIFALHSIPYWVYCSFGLSEYSILTFVAVQGVLFVAISAIPLPGGVGASESGFLMLFKILFPISILNEAMLISRGISFYLFLLLSGIFLLIVWIIDNKNYNNNDKLLTEAR